VHQVTDGEQLREFQFAFKKLMEDYKVDRVVIVERISNGKHAAKMATFKLEAILQVCEGLDVELVPIGVQKQWLKHTAPPIEFKHTGLRPFQEKAFISAYAYLSS